MRAHSAELDIIFDWGDAMLGYRYLRYDFRGDRTVSELSLGGPIISVGVNF